jgi:hypothetical protein
LFRISQNSLPSADKSRSDDAWEDLQRGFRALLAQDPTAKGIAHSCLSELIDDTSLEASWQGRLLWCIDRYQVDPEVRAITMLETPRLLEASEFSFYTHIHVREKGSGVKLSDDVIQDLREEIRYVMDSRTVLEASEKGRALFERLKTTSDQQVLGRFAVKLFHYIMGLIYARSNVIWYVPSILLPSFLCDMALTYCHVLPGWITVTYLQSHLARPGSPSLRRSTRTAHSTHKPTCLISRLAIQPTIS